MESLLENQRNCHEERERCVDLMVKEFTMDKKSQRERINSDQRVNRLLERNQIATQKLISAYQDEHGERSKEIQAIGGPNEFAEFYSRLKTLKDIHRKNPNDTARTLTIEFQEMANFVQDPDRVEKEMVRFMDEEGYGKFLDLHALHEQFVNLKGINRVDYISYLSKFDHLHEIHKEKTKKSGAYKSYIVSLEEYLKDFICRAKPLIDIAGELERVDKDFEQKWKEGKVIGWSNEKSSGALTKFAPSSAEVDLSNFNSSEELEELGADRLKAALLALGLKCGGTVKERASRLLSAKISNVSSNANGKGITEDAKEESRKYNLAKIESRVLRLSELVSAERAATRENVERKQARAVGEEEEEDDVEEVYEVEEEADNVPYNPKNLPLDWDGKPIPYWLYKLHGLNIGYGCEICGNQVYKGPKAFQRHFTEWRHSHGMRCLGIPNTAHFTNITKINDAIELWKKICDDKNRNKWNPEADEEFEDSLGNVVNRQVQTAIPIPLAHSFVDFVAFSPMWRRLSILFCLLLCLCSSQKEPAGQNLILLLVDGYGANLFNQTDSRTKSGTRTLLENGMEATSLKPVYPTQSYPNWFSLATGLYVESHNFTSDFMFEPNSSMLFQRDMGMNDSNPFWWTGYPAPLWYAVGKAGIDVHCYWFPACHKAHVDLIVQVPQNRRHSFNNANKIDLLPHLPTIIKHIKKYQPYRQQLVLLRYNGLDEALRAGGQSSSQTRQALSTVDTYIRRIQEEMDTMDLHQSTNLIVLSDHGLMAVEEEDQFYVEECLADFSMVRQVANSLAFTMIWPIDGEEDTVFFELKVCDQWAFVGDYENEEAAPLVSVYRRHELPEHFHWRDSRLVAPIVLIARPGIVLLTRNLPSTDVSEKLAKEWKMLDGWDNEHEEMQGIFMARGPAFKSHYKGEEQVEVVDIYQLVLNILGVEPTHFSNGSWNRVADVLSEGWEDRRYEPQSFALRHLCPFSFISIFIVTLCFWSIAIDY
uniref:Matrin-type domain-containing protein n=1 Tax=Globodera rostochiensis TaxID=31243 RepID=A0A914H1A5_GLORO